MGILRNRRIVPALMFHSVGLERHRWVWAHLSEHLETFERKIALLRKHNFHTVLWRDVHGYISGKTNLHSNPVLLTFDDGYLDNWVFALPILKKYGMRGTIFVNPDFVDPGDSLRPTLEDVWRGRCEIEDLETVGFLNWAELRAMQATGIVDIQSHTMTHTWYFSGPKIVDFHSPRDVVRYPWLSWNARPDRKPFYLVEDQQDIVPWGHPVFEHERALTARRFFPEDKCVQRILQYVESGGGRDFFESPDAEKQLASYAATLLPEDGFAGRYETEAEYRRRVRDELVNSRALLQAKLNKPVEYVCWPGGASNACVRQIAQEAGYKAWTLGSRDDVKRRNVPGADPRELTRISSDNIVSVKGYGGIEAGPLFLLLKIYGHQDSIVYLTLLRAYKLAVVAFRQSSLRAHA